MSDSSIWGSNQWTRKNYLQQKHPNLKNYLNIFGSKISLYIGEHVFQGAKFQNIDTFCN